MDLKPTGGGKTSPAIYALDGDTLKLVLDTRDQLRALEFKTTRGGSHLLLVLKRK
jgi:hypothetical protein